MAQTLTNGQINCLDPGGFSSITITKSMTIDCHEAPAAILVDVGNNGIAVNFDAFDPSDTRKTVIIRNVNIQGFSTGGVGINLMGVGAGSLVHIEDCAIDGNTSTANGIGIDDQRGRGALIIDNTTVRDMGLDGKTLIHPSQVDICNEVFAPTNPEVESATAIIEAFALPENAGKGVIQLNGRMVELLHADLARRTLAIAQAIAARSKAAA